MGFIGFELIIIYSMSFLPISKKIENFSTFKSFSWDFKLDGKETSLLLECFLLSNKRRIVLNKNQVFQGSKAYFKDFEWSANLGNHVIGIQNGKQTTDLFVDGASFNQIYDYKIPNRMHQQDEEVKVSHVVARDGKLIDDGKEVNDFPFESKSSGNKRESKQVNYDFEEIFK